MALERRGERVTTSVSTIRRAMEPETAISASSARRLMRSKSLVFTWFMRPDF